MLLVGKNVLALVVPRCARAARGAQVGLALSVLVLAGCAMTPTAPTQNTVSSRQAATSVDGHADWAWSVSGDTVVRPIQVFSLGGQTYFQMRAGQRIPAILANGTPVPYRIAPPYLVVTGRYTSFSLLVDGYSARVVHNGPLAAPPAPAEGTDRLHRVSVGSNTLPSSAAATTYATAPEGQIRTVERSVPSTGAVTTASTVRLADQPGSDRVWRIDPTQGMLSSALRDWCAQAGVRLVWRANVDLPIEHEATYRDPKFFGAMASLLSDASRSNYQFFYSVTGDTVTVISVKRS